jgi:hypothetical protein
MNPEQYPQATESPVKYRVIALLALLMLPALACGLTNQVYALNNQVRQAVYRYERETRGRVDDLVLHSQRAEPRVKFEGQNENGGRTVWLDRFAAQEFFALRPAEETFLYIQEIQYGDNQETATVAVYRGDGRGYKGWQLTLEQGDDDRWTVTDEVALEAESP